MHAAVWPLPCRLTTSTVCSQNPVSVPAKCISARTEYFSASKSSLSASTSTASCSSPKVLTQFSALHDAVRTCATQSLSARCQAVSRVQGFATAGMA